MVWYNYPTYAISLGNPLLLCSQCARAADAAPALLALGTPVLALASVGWGDRGELVSRSFDPMIGLFAKPNLGPGRLLLFLAIFLASYLLLTVAWTPSARA